MSDSDFRDLCSIDELPEKGFVVRKLGELEIVVCQLKDGVFAVENRCSHAFASFDEGRLRGNRLMCPLHGACFNVRDGVPFGPPASKPIRSFPVQVLDGRVRVAVGPD